MPQPPSDFLDLLPQAPAMEPVAGPIYYLWVFDPQTGKVIVDHNEGRARHQTLTHRDLADAVAHPERVHGYAYPIRGGVRITDWEHREVKDPFITDQVRKQISN